MAKSLRIEEEKDDGEEVNKEYIDPSFILGTSDIVERFFSLCKYVLTDQRASMTAENFETIVFLKANRDLWGLPEVAEAIKNARNIEYEGI